MWGHLLFKQNRRQKGNQKPGFIATKTFRGMSIALAAVFATTSLSGCLAGNFGMTRKVAQWNLSFSTVPRVIICVALYLVPVYELSAVFDILLNNTVEFWSNEPIVTAQVQTIHKDGYRIVINNSRDPLKRSVFTIFDKTGRVQSISELRETKTGAIDVYVNRELKAEVKSLHARLAEIAVTNPTDPQIINVKAPKKTQKLDFSKLKQVRAILAQNELLAQTSNELLR